MSVKSMSVKSAVLNAVKMTWRQRQVQSVRILFLSILLAVAAVSTIASLASNLKAAMEGSASKFIAGDRQLVSPREVSDEWLLKADELGLKQSRSIEFASMLYVGDDMQLVAVKGVDDNYPLKGELEIFSDTSSERSSVPKGPASGQVWLQNRLLSLLGIAKGGEAYIGDKAFELEHVVAQEPDAGFQVFGIAPRALIHIDDVADTGVVQVGSRLTWRYYFVGSVNALESYDEWIKERLDPAQRWEGVKEGRPAISDALGKTETYLLLGGSLAVLLACIAIAVSARQFSLEQVTQVALMKTLGRTWKGVLSHYLILLGLMAGVASVLGMAFGVFFAQLGIEALTTLVPDIEFTSAGSDAGSYIDANVGFLAVGTALISMFGFALPEFFKLREITPMQIFRQEKYIALGWSWRSGLFSIAMIFALLYLYGKNLTLVILLLVGLCAVMAVIFALAWLIYSVFKKGNNQPGSDIAKPFKHAISALIRRRGHTLIQFCVFSFSMLLVAIVLLARDSLIQDWQSQLPEDTPNHFLINIAPNELASVESALVEQSIDTSGLYPMVRGRLSHINDVPVKVAVTKDVAALNRELNLTWSSALPEDNLLEEGVWWNSAPSLAENGLKGVSVESQLAERLGLEMGDKLLFSIGGRELAAKVTSIRSVQWDSMRPNFYMMFEPGSLSDYPATYITSFYLPQERKEVLNALTKGFPTVSILELDKLVEKVRGMIEQVSAMVELVLAFIFGAALLVMAALISSTMQERKKEAALLRTLGAHRKLITSGQLYEFSILSVATALIAILCAEGVMAVLQTQLFGTSFRLHWDLWLIMPVAATAIIGLIAHLQIRSVPNTSPMVILRAGE